MRQNIPFALHQMQVLTADEIAAIELAPRGEVESWGEKYGPPFLRIAGERRYPFQSTLEWVMANLAVTPEPPA
jgi:hypothetical protein